MEKKKKITDEVSEVKRKRQATENIILSLNKDIIKLRLGAEVNRDFDLLKKASVYEKQSLTIKQS